MSNKNRRGEVYESWVNTFGMGTVFLIIFIIIVLTKMLGWW